VARLAEKRVYQQPRTQLAQKRASAGAMRRDKKWVADSWYQPLFTADEALRRANHERLFQLDDDLLGGRLRKIPTVALSCAVLKTMVASIPTTSHAAFIQVSTL
jgi:hypothetical protein